MRRQWLGIVAISGFLVVLLGAFGAHALKEKVSGGDLVIWQTAIQYQMFHTLALLGVVLLNEKKDQTLLRWSGRLFVVGGLLFCGSLYALVLTGQRWLGVVTPIGGVAFLAAWAMLLLAVIKSR